MSLFSKLKTILRDILLTGASMLVGVLFAVYGQIYQTGANAYDFFLAWTVFITLWVIVSNFAPLWLLYLMLINTTFVLYTQQVAGNWSEVLVLTSLFAINTCVLIPALVLSRYKKSINVPNWFLHLLALASVTFATMGIIMGIFDKFEVAFPLLILLTISVFALGLWHGLQSKSGFYLSVIPFSIILIVSALLIKLSDNEIMFLFVSLFIAGSVTLVIKNLIDLQKKWTNEQ